jgi:5-methylcytosine-specific restriction enzyme A
MPTRASKRCPIPGCTNAATTSGYCAEVHEARREAAHRRTVPTKRTRTTEVRKHRAAAVKAHVEEHDGMGHCPGWGREPHWVFPSELTADDPVPIARGGDPMQKLIAMCRSCNGRKAARPA